MAHKRHGKLPWKDLFQPSIELAEKGFPVGRALAEALEKNKKIIVKDMALWYIHLFKTKVLLLESHANGGQSIVDVLFSILPLYTTTMDLKLSNPDLIKLWAFRFNFRAFTKYM